MPILLLLLQLEKDRTDALGRVLAYFGIDSAAVNRDLLKHAFALLHPYLLRLTAQDVARLGKDAHHLPGLLREVKSPVTRDRLITRWGSSAVDVPRFAQTVLSALGGDLHRHPALKDKLLSVLLPVAIENAQMSDYDASALRHLLVTHYDGVLRGNHTLIEAHQADCERESKQREERERQHQLREEQERERDAQREESTRVRGLQRQSRVGEITRMGLTERVELMLSGSTGVAGPIPIEWAAVSVHEVQALPSTVRLALIRELRAKRHRVYREIRRRLQTPDREEQVRERSALAKSLEGASLLLQLDHLASATIPIGRYPASLADSASAHVSSIPEGLRSRLLVRLVGQRRGVWRSFRDALRQASRPEFS